MASAATKKNCFKCDKGAGTAMCHGCEQSFCTKHFIEHRQELSQQIDNIGQEHDILRRDLANEQGTHPLFARINQWEEESINKVQTAAKSARTDLQRLLNKTKDTMKTSVTEMTEELQSNRESDDYTELDIKKWTKQLQEFRNLLDSPTTVKIDYDNDAQSVIRLIKVADQQPADLGYQSSERSRSPHGISRNLETLVIERFVDAFGKVKLSKDGLEATGLGDEGYRQCVSGIGRYSSGVHNVRFRLDHNSDFYIFLGIINSSETMTNGVLNSTSCHGWWEFDYRVVSGKAERQKSTNTIQKGDEVILMLDCDNRQIRLQHHRTQKTVHIPIDLQLCPFPWRIIVLLRGKDDCVKILQ